MITGYVHTNVLQLHYSILNSHPIRYLIYDTYILDDVTPARTGDRAFGQAPLGGRGSTGQRTLRHVPPAESDGVRPKSCPYRFLLCILCEVDQNEVSTLYRFAQWTS